MRPTLWLLVVLLTAVGCGARSSTPDPAPQDPPTGTGSCSDNPQTHLELLNACTTAERIEKDDSKLPLLQADGTLPPLP